MATYTQSDAAIDYNTEESTLTFGYGKGYANKTDFSNSAVLNELTSLRICH
jgi:hypothetical protein